MGTGTGIVVLAGTAATGFLFFSANRGMKMRDDGHHATEWLWYFSGMLPFAAVSLLWTSMEDQSVTPQRIILFIVGARLLEDLACSLLESGFAHQHQVKHR